MPFILCYQKEFSCFQWCRQQLAGTDWKLKLLFTVFISLWLSKLCFHSIRKAFSRIWVTAIYLGKIVSKDEFSFTKVMYRVNRIVVGSDPEVSIHWTPSTLTSNMGPVAKNSGWHLSFLLFSLYLFSKSTKEEQKGICFGSRPLTVTWIVWKRSPLISLITTEN